MAFSYFRPFATGINAMVLSAGSYAAQSWVSTGFQPGIADPTSVNTVWRQGAFVAAGITQWMANTLNTNINDDGNLGNFITLFNSSITLGISGGVTSFNTRQGAVTLFSSDVIAALGYTPVISFNSRTGNVTLTKVDVNTALGYQPVNKAVDTMGGLLSGLTPTSPSHYATKAYADATIAAGHAAGNINGNATELNFPLGDGGLIKVGQYFPPVSPSLQQYYSSPTAVWTFAYAIAFVTPFKTKCVSVRCSLIWEPQSIPYQTLNSQPTTFPTPGTNMGIWIDYDDGFGPFLSSIVMNQYGFLTENVEFNPQASGSFYNPGQVFNNVAPGFIWTAIGY